jgi:hypothetical protein
LIDPEAPVGSNVLTIDWEGIGLGVGPSELAWFLISHVNPTLRRENEKKLLDEYYEALISLGVNNYSKEQCYEDYTLGCLGKWMWYFGFFGAANLPESVV